MNPIQPPGALAADWLKRAAKDPSLYNRSVVNKLPFTDEELRLRMTADLSLRVDQARVSLVHFYHLVFTDESGNGVIIEKCHHEWCKALQDPLESEVFIEGSRESTKTTALMAAVLWTLGGNHNLRFLWVSENGDAAEKRISTVSYYIQNSVMLKLVFPDLALVGKNDKRKNNTSTLNIFREAESQDDSLRGVGVLSPGTGSRNDVLVLDDAVGQTNAVLNPANKPRVLQKILSDWIPTVSRKGGRIWAAFNPWADDDAMSILKKRTYGFYKVYAHGVEGDPYKSFCEKLWSREALLKKRRLLGEIVYLRSYCCKTRPKGQRDVIVHPAHLHPIHPDMLIPSILPFLRVTISGDPASGKSAEDKEHVGTLDYNGCCVSFHLLREDILKEFDLDPADAASYKVQLSPILLHLMTHLETVMLIIDCFGYRSSPEEQARILWHLAAHYQANEILVETVGLAALDTVLRLTKGTLPNAIRAKVTNTQIIPVGVGNRSKGDRLLATSPYLNPPAPTPPAIYFHPQTIPSEPEEEQSSIDIPGFPDPIQIERPLRRQMLDFPQKNDDAMDSYTQAVNYTVFNHPPFPVSDEDGGGGNGSGLSVGFIGFR